MSNRGQGADAVPTAQPLSERVRRIELSASMAMAARAGTLRAAGRDVLSMAVGELDFATPAHVIEAAHRAAKSGFTRYTAPDGHPLLKAAIRAKLLRDNGLAYSDAELHAASGCKQVIFNALASTVDGGDEVIVFSPYWVSYCDLVTFCGGRPVAVRTQAADGFLPDPAALERALGPRTKWIILNTPNNPTGAVYPRELLVRLAEVALRHPAAMVLADEIYEHLVYDGQRHVSIVAAAPELAHRCLTVNGVSKSYAMTGWRIGFGAGPQWLVTAMAKVQSQTSGNSCSIAQAAAAEALSADQSLIAVWRGELQARRDRALSILRNCPHLGIHPNAGSFYTFIDVSGCISARTPGGALLLSDDDVCEYLLEAAGVATVAGSAFGASPFVRLSLAADEATICDACTRIVVACSALSTCADGASSDRAFENPGRRR